MLRYKTKTRPGLVALYNIRPGNGAGPFLQPRSPHGACYFGRCLTKVLSGHYSRFNWVSHRSSKEPLGGLPVENFLQDRCPSCQSPYQQCQSTRGMIFTLILLNRNNRLEVMQISRNDIKPYFCYLGRHVS